MSNNSDSSGCGCIVIIVLIIGGIISGINGCWKEKKSRDLAPDYSSHRSEEGRFIRDSYDMIGVNDFRVADGVGYLRLNRGEVVKMWRNGYGEYEGRYDGFTYTARKTAQGYEVRRKR